MVLIAVILPNQCGCAIMNANVEFINAFVKGAIHVLKTMAFTEAKAGKPYLKADQAANGDVSGIIGMTGESEGSMSISFSESSICAIVSSMFGETFDKINEDVKDAVGELTNMICGDARRELEEKGFMVKGAIPTVITGYNHSVKHISSIPVVAIPFTISAGNFVLEISLAM